jgi:hypothetical protein
MGHSVSGANCSPIEITGGTYAIWVSDLTYLRVGLKWICLSVIMNLWAREEVGLSSRSTMKPQETAISALKMAHNQCLTALGLIFSNGPRNVILQNLTNPKFQRIIRNLYGSLGLNSFSRFQIEE